MVTDLWTGLEKFEQVWTGLNRCEVQLFLNRETHALQILPTLKPACRCLTVPLLETTTLRSGGNSPLLRFNWRKLWSDVNCNFSSAQLHELYVVWKLSIRPVGMCIFTRIGCKKRVTAFDNCDTNMGWSAWAATTPQGMNYRFSSPDFGEPYVVWKLLIREAFICSFSRISRKINKLQLWKVLARKLRKFRLTSLYAALEEPTSVRQCSSTSRTPLESSQLAELRYAFFRRTGCKTKKLRPSNLLSLMISKPWLLEGSTILFRYSYTSRMALESSQVCELKYAISAG